jgi:hypothetical protein
MPRAWKKANAKQYPRKFQSETIVVTYEIRVFFEGAQKEVFSSILKETL